MATILITGGTGLVGQVLTTLLLSEGYEVRYLSRSAKPVGAFPQVGVYAWDIEAQTIDMAALDGVEAVVHLAGAGVADKSWTAARKTEILTSRTESTRLLATALARLPAPPKVLVSASAIGYYGLDTGAALQTEDSPAGQDFLADVTGAWEDALVPITNMGIRTVKLRIGIVLSTQGGALPKLIAPIKLGVGAALGSGQQYMSWIHIEDLVRMFLYCIQNSHTKGVYNAVAPNPVTNVALTREAAKVLKRPLILPPVPAFALRLVLGEMAQMVLGGNKVSATRIVEAGFRFRFEQLLPALEDLLG
ncbi:TIGR01777 family oxidoreductase [Eisenibacter elegans]|uniref:TIGR01777 family oxidoreductase n=1 Tax=Eisenibacter elegans TaxID=997 RepID=UPI000420DCC6|nr:TIGR01777 family oxidoreductase [Eisenibacter elegans]